MALQLGEALQRLFARRVVVGPSAPQIVQWSDAADAMNWLGGTHGDVIWNTSERMVMRGSGPIARRAWGFFCSNNGLEEHAFGKKAVQRARNLLRSFLTPEQRREFDEGKPVTHHGKRFRYEIGMGRVYNIMGADGCGYLSMICSIPVGAHTMPSADIVLAQLLRLRDDEDGFLGTANINGPFSP